MKTIAILAALSFALPAFAQSLPVIQYRIESNLQQTQKLGDQSFSQGSSVVMDFSISQGGRWLNLSGLTAAWYGQETQTSTQRLEHASATTVTNVTPNYFRITLDSGATGTARTNWLYSLVVSDSTPNSYTIGQGRLDIVAGTWTGPAAVLVTPTVEAYLEERLDGIEGEITTNVLAQLTWENVVDKPFTNISDIVHSDLSGLGWVESGHTGTAARVAIFSEGGFAGEGTLGPGLTWDGDTINVSESDPFWSAVSNAVTAGAAAGATAVQPATLDGYATTDTVAAVSAVADAALPSSDFVLKTLYYGDGDIEVTDASLFGFDSGTGNITSYTGSVDHVVIPWEIDGVAVTGVSGIGIFGNNPMVSITGPVGLTSLSGPDMFYGCFNLRSMSFPSVTNIGTSVVFIDGGDLRYANFPSVQSVGQFAFEGAGNNILLQLGRDKPAEASGVFQTAGVTVVVPIDATSWNGVATWNGARVVQGAGSAGDWKTDGDHYVDTLYATNYPATQPSAEITRAATNLIEWTTLERYITPANGDVIEFAASPLDYNERMMRVTFVIGTNSVSFPSTNLPHFAWADGVTTADLTNSLVQVMLISPVQTTNVLGRISYYE
jgi:hypothetical protein